jgi:integrase
MPKLTTTFVEKIKPPAHRVEIPDTMLPGFYLVLQPSGHRSWCVRYRHAGRTRKYTLGRVEVLPLALARDRAREALQGVAAGRDPAVERKRARAGEQDLVSHIVALFIERHVRANLRARSVEGAEHLLKRHVLPTFGNRRIQEITRRDIVALLDSIVDDGKAVTANRTLSVLSKMFGWCVERSILETSPCMGVKRPAVEISRDRVLSDDELALVWQAADRLGYPFGTFAQLLVLLGQRRSETAGMRWSEITGTVWTIPGERTKNGWTHEVPLSAFAQALLAKTPRIANSDFVLTLDGIAPISGFATIKRQIDAQMLAVTRGSDNPAWRFHDLRRSLASGLARLGQPIHIIEAVLNHRSGVISGVAAIYNRHQYLDEKRAALEQWARHLKQLADRDGNASE